MKLATIRRRAVLALLVASVTVGGCASTRGLRSTAAMRGTASLAAGHLLDGIPHSTAWPARDWWKAAGDPALDALVGEALAANPDLALADARVRAALAAAGVADAARKPTVNAGASVSGARLPPILPPLASGHFKVIRYADLSFNWSLDLWGGRRAAWQAAVGNARAAAVDAEAARLTLASAVVQAYYNLGGTAAQRDLAQAELARARDFLKLTEKRVDNGLDSRFTRARIEGEVASDQANLEAANNAVRHAGLALAALLGAGPGRARSITPPKLPDNFKLALPDALPAELLGRRPDVIAARWRVEAAGADIKAAKARFLPNLGISALAGLLAPSGIDFFRASNRFYTVGPALSLPIFEGGTLRANLAGKDAARDAAVAVYNRTLVNAVDDVAGRVADLESLAREVKAAAIARDSADTAYRYAIARYRGGVGSFLEALSVRQELIAAERQLARIETRRAIAWAALHQALGGGFKPAADAPTLPTSTNTPPLAAKATP